MTDSSIVTISLFCVLLLLPLPLLFMFFLSLFVLLLLLFIIIGCWAPRVLGSGCCCFFFWKLTEPSHSTFTIFMIMYCDYIFPSLIVLRQIRHRVVVIVVVILVGVWMFTFSWISHSLVFRNNIHCRSGRTVANYYSFPIFMHTNIHITSIYIYNVRVYFEAPHTLMYTLHNKLLGSSRWWYNANA